MLMSVCPEKRTVIPWSLEQGLHPGPRTIDQ